MNKEQIIDEVYERYSKEYEKDSSIGFRLRHKDKNGNPTYGKGNKESFINKCKIDSKFSKKWGLHIEERELSLEERAKWLQDNKGYDLLVGNLEHDHIREVVEDEAPTKVITTKYQNETVITYE